MDASLAATGIFDVLATNVVLFITDSSRPSGNVIVNCGKSINTWKKSHETSKIDICAQYEMVETQGTWLCTLTKYN